MPQIMLDEWELETLSSHLSSWLQTPVNRLAKTPLHAVADLTGSTDYQLFEMKFGASENRVVPIGQTEYTISYEVSAVSGEIAYVVDQSCVRVFVDGINRYSSIGRQA